MKYSESKKLLYPFQQDAVSFIDATDGRCILGDEMGLGKTVESLVWATKPSKSMFGISSGGVAAIVSVCDGSIGRFTSY